MSTHNLPTQPEGTSPEVPSCEVEAEQSQALTWIKRGLIAGAIAGIAYGGYQSYEHAGEVESALGQQAGWTVPALAATETAAWGGAAVMVGAMGAKKSFRNISNVTHDIPSRMRELEDSKLFQIGMKVNIAGAVGTTSVMTIGAEALPESARPLAYGVAAASLGLSSIPIKVAYMIDNHNQRRAK